jgi:hypothetical protein
MLTSAMRTQSIGRRRIGAVAILTLSCACAPAPIQKPISLGDVNTGANSLEAVRRQLNGTWTLVSYELMEGTRSRRLDAAAQMTYDEFGNLTMRGELKDPGAPGGQRPTLLNYSGRAVIDVTSKQLRLMSVNAAGDPLPSAVAERVDPAMVRLYEFQGSTLWLRIAGPDGKITASSSWTKNP